MGIKNPGGTYLAYFARCGDSAPAGFCEMQVLRCEAHEPPKKTARKGPSGLLHGGGHHDDKALPQPDSWKACSMRGGFHRYAELPCPGGPENPGREYSDHIERQSLREWKRSDSTQTNLHA